MQSLHALISRAAESSKRGLERGIKEIGMDDKPIHPLRAGLILDSASSIVGSALDAASIMKRLAIVVSKLVKGVVESVNADFAGVKEINFNQRQRVSLLGSRVGSDDTLSVQGHDRFVVTGCARAAREICLDLAVILMNDIDNEDRFDARVLIIESHGSSNLEILNRQDRDARLAS